MLAGMVALGAGLGGTPSDNLSVPGLPAAEGAVVLQRAFPGQGAADGTVVVRSDGAPVTSGAGRTAIGDAARRLREVPGMRSVTVPGAPGTVSADGRTAMIGIEWSTPADELGAADLAQVRAAARPLERADSRWRTRVPPPRRRRHRAPTGRRWWGLPQPW